MTRDLALDLSQSAEPIARQVLHALRHAIVTMRIKPGEMLSEQEIADRLRVSRSPVREAFIKLGEAGLVRILPQRGTQVVKISQAAVEDARFIREAIERAVVREAAACRDARAHARIADNLARQRRAVRAKDTEAFFDLDEEFHRLLAAAAGRPSAWHIVEDLKPQMDRVRYLSIEHATPMHVIVAQHTAIAEAVTAGDAPRAEAALHDHLTEILRALPELASQYPDLFEYALPTPLSA